MQVTHTPAKSIYETQTHVPGDTIGIHQQCYLSLFVALSISNLEPRTSCPALVVAQDPPLRPHIKAVRRHRHGALTLSQPRRRVSVHSRAAASRNSTSRTMCYLSPPIYVLYIPMTACSTAIPAGAINIFPCLDDRLCALAQLLLITWCHPRPSRRQLGVASHTPSTPQWLTRSKGRFLCRKSHLPSFGAAAAFGGSH